MDKNIDELVDLLARKDRLETGLGIKIDRFIDKAIWKKDLNPNNRILQ